MSMQEQFLKQRIEELERLLSFAMTGMRNAITDIQDGDYDGAVETLEQFVGEQTEKKPRHD